MEPPHRTSLQRSTLFAANDSYSSSSDEEEEEDTRKDEEDEEEEEDELRLHARRLSQRFEQTGGQAGRWCCASCSFINGTELLTCQVCTRPRRRRLEDEAQDHTQRFAHFSIDLHVRFVRAVVCGADSGR